MTDASEIRVGIAPPVASSWWSDPRARSEYVRLVTAAGLDHLFIADHVSFRDGSGADGLVQAATLLGMQPDLDVQVGVYLLALRHPVPVARQLATLAEHAPGRLSLGVGVGGDDRHEFEVCEVDPATRGRRTDEALQLVRALLTGEAVDHRGDFFEVTAARILPVPEPPIPIVIGGKVTAALRRAAVQGDGWLAAFCTHERFAQGVRTVEDTAVAAGRSVDRWQHGYQGWIGVSGDAGDRLAAAMESFYHVPFERFARYAPVGEPSDIATHFGPFVDSGCRSFNFVPVAASVEDSIERLGEVKRLLQG